MRVLYTLLPDVKFNPPNRRMGDAMSGGTGGEESRGFPDPDSKGVMFEVGITHVGSHVGLAAILIALPCAAAAQDAAAMRKGARLYQNYCSTCHGDDLLNNSGIAFDLRRLRADEHSRFVNSVLRGKNAMPSWDGKLSADEIESLWAYIRAHANP